MVNLDPRTDFGRHVYRTPACVVEPSTQDQLAECVRRLRGARVPLTVRGAAHSADGQVLTDGGVVISTRRLCRILFDVPTHQRICVEGGALWADVVRFLRPLARQPLVLTGDLLTSVGGTLSAGGVGTASFKQGLQITTVTKIRVVLANGELVTLTPDDELFRYVLAGAGQLGIIAQAEIRTRAAGPDMGVWHLQWPSAEAFAAAVLRLRTRPDLEILRGRFYYGTTSAAPFIDSYVGVSCARSDAAPLGRAPSEVWPPDPIPDQHSAPTATQAHVSATLRFFLPLPAGFAIWEAIQQDLHAADLTRYMRTGSSITVLRGASTFPLAPLPDSDNCLFLGLYPEVPRENGPHAVAVVRRIADRVIQAGGRIDATSILPRMMLLEQQFGRELGRLRELKARLDPDGLFNADLLGGRRAGSRNGTASHVTHLADAR